MAHPIDEQGGMAHEGAQHGKHNRTWMHSGPAQWSSWDSPVGIGIFFLLSAFAIWVTLNVFFSLTMGAFDLMHPATQYGNAYEEHGMDSYGMMRGR